IGTPASWSISGSASRWCRCRGPASRAGARRSRRPVPCMREVGRAERLPQHQRTGRRAPGRGGEGRGAAGGGRAAGVRPRGPRAVPVGGLATDHVRGPRLAADEHPPGDHEPDEVAAPAEARRAAKGLLRPSRVPLAAPAAAPAGRVVRQDGRAVSVAAVNWALQQKAGDARAKVLLLALACLADKEHRCFPGRKYLSSVTELTADEL